MKKVLKSRIFYFILGIVIATSITAYATITYQASQIKYTKSDNSEVTLDTALNELYTDADTITDLENQIITKDSTISSLNTTLNTYSTFSTYFQVSSGGYLQFIMSNLKVNGYSTFKITNPWKASSSTVCDISKIYNQTSKKEENSGYSYNQTYTLPNSSNRFIFKATGGACDFQLYLYR